MLNTSNNKLKMISEPSEDLTPRFNFNLGFRFASLSHSEFLGLIWLVLPFFLYIILNYISLLHLFLILFD